MNRLFLLLITLFLFNMRPFWDLREQSVQINLKGNNNLLCSTSNHYLFKKNSIINCIKLKELNDSIDSLSNMNSRKKYIKIIFADEKERYIKPIVSLGGRNYLLENILYYPTKKRVYFELKQNEKYYFFRINQETMSLN